MELRSGRERERIFRAIVVNVLEGVEGGPRLQGPVQSREEPAEG
jgi:hypothetical protein